MRARSARRRARWFREDLLAWVLFIAVTTAIFLGTRYWLNRRVLPEERDLSTLVHTPKIVVLAFDRIVTDPAPNKIARDQLRGHLIRLAREGFVAISLETLFRFYEEDAPLPEKSLVLTFDHGYLSTYEAVDPLLRELDWPAVLFIMTERQERRDPFFVYWDRVDRMVSTGLWDIGSHGHRGHDPIAVDAEGNEGPFFIRAMWLPDAGRQESWEEFRTRVWCDHELARDILSSHIRGNVLAYAPPLRDVAGLTASPEAHQTLEEIVSATYRLAFFDDRFGVNDRWSNPRRLRRLRVNPTWSSEELLRRIDSAMGKETGDGPGEASWTRAWVSGSGQASLVDGKELVVSGTRRADVWRAGSQWVEDWELEMDVYSEGGELWVVQESELGPTQWRFGGTAERTYLQTRSPGERTDVIESYPARWAPGRWHHLHLIKRGLGIWVELDGEVLTEHPTYLPGRWRGNVGIVHWNPGQAEVRLRNLRFERVPFRVRPLSSSLTTDEIQEAIAEAPQISALSPHVFDLGPHGLRTISVDERLLRILSHRFGWEIVPTLRVSDPESETSGELEAVLAFPSSPEFSGLRVEWSGGSEKSRKRFADELQSRARELSWKSGRLIVPEVEVHP